MGFEEILDHEPQQQGKPERRPKEKAVIYIIIMVVGSMVFAFLSELGQPIEYIFGTGLGIIILSLILAIFFEFLIMGWLALRGKKKKEGAKFVFDVLERTFSWWLFIIIIQVLVLVTSIGGAVN